MRSGGITLAAATFVALVACTKKTPEPTTADAAPSAVVSAASATSAATAATTAPAPTGRSGHLDAGASCEGATFSNNDCERRPGCDTKCLALFDASNKKKTGSRCFLIAPNGQPGSSPCVADVEGTSIAYHPKEGAERGVACDVLHNDAYCELTSRVCTKSKPAGADCESHFECGRDGACDSKTKKCIASATAGAKCTEYRCASTAYCERKANLCFAKKADGSSCGGSDECTSVRCNNGLCMPAQTETCTLN